MLDKISANDFVALANIPKFRNCQTLDAMERLFFEAFRDWISLVLSLVNALKSVPFVVVVVIVIAVVAKIPASVEFIVTLVELVVTEVISGEFVVPVAVAVAVVGVLCLFILISNRSFLQLDNFRTFA